MGPLQANIRRPVLDPSAGAGRDPVDIARNQLARRRRDEQWERGEDHRQEHTTERRAGDQTRIPNEREQSRLHDAIAGISDPHRGTNTLAVRKGRRIRLSRTNEREAEGRGCGSGFGLDAKPVGAFEIRGDDVTWRPAIT